MNHRNALAALAALCLGLASLPPEAQVALRNPGIPARETAVYRRVTGGKTESVTMSLALREEKGQRWYEYTNRSPEADVTARLDADSLFARQVDTLGRQGGSTVKRTLSVVDPGRQPEGEAVLLTGNETLSVSLRGFPFGAKKKAELVFVGTGRQGSSMDFEITVTGKETITAAGRIWECWKVQVGLGGIWAAFGKSSLWYTVAAPAILIKSEGAAGPPGSPIVVLELVSYSASELP